jgi:hypothetical protein
MFHLYDGSPVYHQPEGLDLPPKDCQPLASLSKLVLGQRVYLEGVVKGIYCSMTVKSLDKAPYASSEQGFAAFLEERAGQVVGSIYFNENALSRVDFAH